MTRLGSDGRLPNSNWFVFPLGPNASETIVFGSPVHVQKALFISQAAGSKVYLTDSNGSDQAIATLASGATFELDAAPGSTFDANYFKYSGTLLLLVQQ